MILRAVGQINPGASAIGIDNEIIDSSARLH